MDNNFSRKLLLLTISFLTIATSMGCTSSKPPTSSVTAMNQQPVDVMSVAGPLSPINPGGPVVEITLKNVSSDAVTSLSATLQLNRDFNFNFNISSSSPLLPGKSTSTRLTLISGSFSDTIYSLMINGTMQNGSTFTYTKQVQIVKQ